MSKKHIRSEDRIGLKLTQAERSLLLEGLTLLPSEFEDAVKGTPAKEPVMLTVDDLDELGDSKPRKAKEPKTKADSHTIYQFKITLRGSKPPIWRRIQVADCTLDKLHEHIQTAMTRKNTHDTEIVPMLSQVLWRSCHPTSTAATHWSSSIHGESLSSLIIKIAVVQSFRSI